MAERDAVRLRPALRGDAGDMARLVDMAGEGLARHVWQQAVGPGADPFAHGESRAARDEGAFSWRNGVIAEVEGAVAGLLVAYRIGDAPEPLDDLPEMFRPLQALENRALGTLYVNVLATYPEFRRRGVGTALLAEAERQGEGAAGLSLIVADANETARRLYRRFGFVDAGEEPLIADGWATESNKWILMLKPAASA